MAQANDIDTVYFGNPIFDITVDDADRSVMNKYSLELGMASLATPEQMPIYDELWAREDKLGTPGGSALNSARAQKHANSAGSVAYFGCIADDAFGNALNDSVNAAGIDGKFDKSTTNATGTCAAVVVGKERTLCANIAAAKDFKLEYLQANMVSQSSISSNLKLLSSSFRITFKEPSSSTRRASSLTPTSRPCRPCASRLLP